MEMDFGSACPSCVTLYMPLISHTLVLSYSVITSGNVNIYMVVPHLSAASYK